MCFKALDAFSPFAVDTVTELQVSNSKLSELEAALTAQKSEVRLKTVHFSQRGIFHSVTAGKAEL